MLLAVRKPKLSTQVMIAFLVIFRSQQEQNVLVLANFSEQEQEIVAKRLRMLGMRKIFTDIVSGKTISAVQKLVLEPYQFAILL